MPWREIASPIMQTLAPYITFDHVEVAYNDFVSGLRSVTFQIDKGEFVFLCGQTGSGKSTIIKVLSGQVKPTKGKVMIESQDIGALAKDEIPFLRRKMGIVPQDFGLLPNKKVWENVGYAMRAVGKSRTDVRQQVPDILERVNILHRADAYPTELSGGEQQRVAIARALINDPPLLLADEPTGNLDPEHSEEITDLLLSLHARGTTVIVATHDMAVVDRVGHRILRMSAGRIDSRTPEEIAADDQADQNVVFEPNDEPAPPSQPAVTDPEEGTDG